MKILIKTQLLVALLVSPSAFAGGDAVQGKALYASRCAACHSIDYNGVGPAHRGVFGRKAGSLSNYTYSQALITSNTVWAEKTLSLWLANPEKFIPGQKMGYSLPNAQDRADIIAYLKTETANQ
jgi:cytochrome c